ncbi:MAG: LptF/LptG family permease [Bacteroidetes bacterium]|nr:LptF/LptG family permease [Bacteroidota bacterium]
MFLTFFIVTFILIMQFLWLYIDELVGKGLGLGVILEFLMWGTSTIFPISLPLATLLASIMTLGTFGENNELLAMKAAGISLRRILTPLVLIAVVISIAAFFAANNLVPLAYKKIYALRADIGQTREEIKLPTGIFYNGIDNYTLKIDERNKKTGMLYGIMIYDHSALKGNVCITLADSGSIKLTADKKNVVFRLFHGYRYQEGERKNILDTSFVMQRTKFDEQDAIISLNDYGFKRSDDDRFGNEIMAQNLVSLGQRRDSLAIILSEIHHLFYTRFIALDIFSHGRQFDTLYTRNRHSLFPLDSIPPYRDIEEEMQSLSRSTEKLDAAISRLDNFSFEYNREIFPLRKTSLEWFRKFTLSFACLIFFFIGAPLGAIIRKGGLGMPVIISCFFFVIYWVIDISGKKLATDGVLSPAMGAIISSAVLLPIGIFLTRKATTDSSLFNTDAYIQVIKKFFNSIFSKNTVQQ